MASRVVMLLHTTSIVLPGYFLLVRTSMQLTIPNVCIHGYLNMSRGLDFR